MIKLSNLKYSEILKQNRIKPRDSKAHQLSISILSNISINQISEILEYSLKECSLSPSIRFGDYDNILQNSYSHNNSDFVIVFWEAINFFEGFASKIEQLNNSQIDEFICQKMSEIDSLVENLKHTGAVLINKFTAAHWYNNSHHSNKIDKVTMALNDHLSKSVPDNFYIVNIEKILTLAGLDDCINLNLFYLASSLYTPTFFKLYVDHIAPIILSHTGRSKKAIIFDCDNTLWLGVVGEDGTAGIEMSRETYSGKIYNEVQTIAKSLSKNGALVCLCSKNNLSDVDEVIKNHKDMVLKYDDIVAKRINWNDKASNIASISEELNIGLDSIIFVDDSDFEIDLVNNLLPDVYTVKVPKNISEFPKRLLEASSLIYSPFSTSEDANKTKMYKDQKKRKSHRESFASVEDYISSLGIGVSVIKNRKDVSDRLFQMCQKTNQFNLTTKRYSKIEIESLIDSDNFEVFAFSVSDRFGDSGITALMIIEKDHNIAKIDSFLMSCRVIGRNIESLIMKYIVEWCSLNGISKIDSSYIKTKKNNQVEMFYENLGFKLVETKESKKLYSLATNEVKIMNISYMEISDE
jgi:FkbH-like protein